MAYFNINYPNISPYVYGLSAFYSSSQTLTGAVITFVTGTSISFISGEEIRFVTV